MDRGRGLDFTNISAPATAIRRVDGATWSGTLSPAIPPQVTSITPTTGPDGGYLALSLLGVPPVAGVGDDTITNFNVPTFFYGGESYTRIGVVSNGYIVVGGGDSGDIVFTPQTFPNAARPNNVLAPLWTDLNPAAAGAIRVATLGGGGFTLARRRLGRREELRQRDDAQLRGLDPALEGAGTPGPRARRSPTRTAPT